MPTKTWVQGEEVLAADMNNLIQKQVVSTFASAAQRDSAITAPTEGMICYQADTKLLMSYRNGLWRPPIGTVLSTGSGVFQNINQGVNGIYDVPPNFENGVSYPYDTLMKADVILYAGFGGSAVNMTGDIVALSNGTSVFTAPSPMQAIAAAYIPMPMSAVWGVGPNGNTGFKARINFQAGPNIHTAGVAAYQHVVHV